ncbi:MAG: G1 family glutamic endopeptidase [Trebonia sp.]
MTRPLLRILLYPFAAVLVAAGLTISLGTAAGASTRPSGSASAHAAAVAQSFIRHLMVGQHSADERAGHALKVNGQTQVQSNNWSGYADTGSSFSKVSASWTEPAGSCGLGESLAAFWVGIDGYNSSSVEQDGTMIECYLGTEYMYTWWEMYPTNSVQTVGSTVAAGDKITASVVRTGTSYALKVTDSTHPADSFSTTQSCSSCTNASAEWIAEAPSGTFGVYPLTDFGTWNATGASVTKGSTAGTISSFPDDEITMADDLGLTQAQPGALSGGGSAFSVTWKSSD